MVKISLHTNSVARIKYSNIARKSVLPFLGKRIKADKTNRALLESSLSYLDDAQIFMKFALRKDLPKRYCTFASLIS